MAYRPIVNTSPDEIIDTENPDNFVPLANPALGTTSDGELIVPSKKKPSKGDTCKLIVKWAVFGLFLAAGVSIYFVPLLTDYLPARHCLAAAIIVIGMWVTEATPVWAASLLVPVLVVWGGAYSDPTQCPRVPDSCEIATGCPLLPTDQAAKRAASKLFSATVLLAFGAFTMSAALTKYQLSDRLAYFILSRVGRRPVVVTISVMLLGLFLSMWVTNVASPVVCLSVVQPIIRELSPEEPFIRVLLLAIAFSNNIGGMTTPISSPQNLVAMSATNQAISWGQWLAVSMPTAILCTLISLVVVWLFFRPKLRELPPLPEVNLSRFGVKHVIVIVVCLATIVLWAVNKQIERFTGDTGITGLLPVVIFFSTGILTKNDFKNLPWDVLMLLAGGMVLGDAMSDQLLCLVANTITDLVHGQGVWVIALTFVTLMWIIGNFISHTVSAIILIPVVASVAQVSGVGHTLLLVMTTTLIDSGAMGLPVSSFPNAQMYSEQDKHGRPFLTGADFMKTGFLIGILEIGVVVSVSYFIGLALNM